MLLIFIFYIQVLTGNERVDEVKSIVFRPSPSAFQGLEEYLMKHNKPYILPRALRTFQVTFKTSLFIFFQLISE